MLGLAALSIGWSADTIRSVAWSSVEFFPDDLRRQVLRHHLRYDAGIERGLAAPPSWRAAAPGSLGEALEAQLDHCAQSLRQPVPLDDLVEEIGVLAVRVLDAADPLAASHADPREPRYAAAYAAYVDSVRGRLRLVYYGQDAAPINALDPAGAVASVLERSRSLYPYVGEEFYRTGALRDWRSIDDRSVAYGVTAISLSRGLTDLASARAWRRSPPLNDPRAFEAIQPTILPHGGTRLQALCRSRQKVDPVDRLKKTLREHYVAKRERYAAPRSSRWDADLLRIFSESPRGGGESAVRFLRRHRCEIREEVSRWTGEYVFTLDQVIKQMLARCRELKLHATGSERRLKLRFCILLAARASHYLYRRREWHVL